MAKKKSSGRGGRKRRGSGEAMTGAGEASVETRTPVETADVELSAADIKTHFDAIKTSTERKDSAVSHLRTAKKRANDACAGLADEIDFVIKLERKNDPAAYARKMKVRNLVLAARGYPIQLDIFDTLQGDQEDQVTRRFFEAGKAGRGFDCKYPENSDLAQIARESWLKGQAALVGADEDEVSGALRPSDEPLSELATAH